jgi:NAD(P)-dependent dehydrogenase (short-subunit alcohol dehydrogenase family)
MKWNFDHIPAQDGRVAVVTGANSGLGFQISRALAGRGARVLMAVRDTGRGEKAGSMIMNDFPSARLEVLRLDLGDLSSVSAFADDVLARFERLDLLVNNAGLMAIPYRKTVDGFEMQFGVNHLGHFALTARLWPLIVTSPGSRVISVSSIAHHIGRIRFQDLNWENGYRRWAAYGMSKLANLLFIKELAGRVNGEKVLVAAAHPGYADTALQSRGALMEGARLRAWSFNMANKLVGQTAEMGALPVLYAATAPDVAQGSYFGPAGWFRMWGYPSADRPNSGKMDDLTARRLWEVSEEMTGIRFPVD